MRKFEIMMVLRPDLDDEQIRSVVERFVNIITDHDGEVTAIEPWGKRRLAYEINDYKDGFYVLINYEADGSFNKELERNFRIVDTVIRHIIVRQDA
jgi:small subunit ribosomal protein S6